jgi:hypothetical protein
VIAINNFVSEFSSQKEADALCGGNIDALAAVCGDAHVHVTGILYALLFQVRRVRGSHGAWTRVAQSLPNR